MLPAYNRNISSCLAEQQKIGAVLEGAGLLQHLPTAREIEVQVHGPIMVTGISLTQAHGDWNESYFRELTTPEGLRRQSVDSICPVGLFKVTASCIEKRCPGMGSHYGFFGLYVSLLVSISENEIWDARSEPAT